MNRKVFALKGDVRCLFVAVATPMAAVEDHTEGYRPDD